MCVEEGGGEGAADTSTLAAPRANDCISCSGRERPTPGEGAARRRRARPGRLRGALLLPAGWQPRSGRGAPEAHSGDEAASPSAGASRGQGPRTKPGKAGGAPPRADGGACTCIARRASALPARLNSAAPLAGSGFTRSHFVSPHPTPPLPSPLTSPPPRLPPFC